MPLTKTKGRLSNVCNEVVQVIIAYLPLQDAINLREACYDGVRLPLERIDTCTYLQKSGPFANAEQLLCAMSQHHCILSGSRALEFFVPGSCLSDSDWDFYMPYHLPSVLAVKTAFEQAGVSF